MGTPVPGLAMLTAPGMAATGGSVAALAGEHEPTDRDGDKQATTSRGAWVERTGHAISSV
jgi:hypothetical protein